jgi:hypothetical protein
VADPRGTHEPGGAEGDARPVIQNKDLIEATTQPGMSSGQFDAWEWGAWGVGIVVTTLAGIVGFFYRAIETRNAKDIQMLTMINERLSKEVEELQRSQMTISIENAVLKQENTTLKAKVESLEQRLYRYEQGHGA